MSEFIGETPTTPPRAVDGFDAAHTAAKIRVTTARKCLKLSLYLKPV